MQQVGRFSISRDHPCLPGHFPGRPVVPGVVLLQATLTAILRHYSATRVAELDAVRFITPVLPEQEVEIGLTPVGSDLVNFACSVDGRQVARGRARLLA
jgi:3-hydroxyacyl-[acyl-carrier-protein] dehydratase